MFEDPVCRKECNTTTAEDTSQPAKEVPQSDLPKWCGGLKIKNLVQHSGFELLLNL